MDEHEQAISERCQESVERIASALPRDEVACLLRIGDLLRHVAHEGRRRLIYEVAREQGGIVWRAAENRASQLVADVSTDPDYLTSDEAIRSELAVPVLVAGEVVAVLDIESAERTLGDGDVALAEEEAARLARELAPLYA